MAGVRQASSGSARRSLEAAALAELTLTKVRTLGITAVSAVALWFKARQFGEAQKLAYRVLANVAQRTLFGPEIPSIEEITNTFLSFLRASADDPEIALAERVPDREYRGTLLKLTRALAPTGKDFSVLTMRRSSTDANPITLTEDSRKEINTVIRQQFTKPRLIGETPSELRGILRAVNLDKDWLELTMDGEHVRVYDVREAVDDVMKSRNSTRI